MSDPAEISQAGSPLRPKEESSPALAEIGSAVGALTILCSARREHVIGSSALFYPLIGLALGVVSLAIDYVGRLAAGRLLASVAVVLVAAVLTGGRPALGLSRMLIAGLTSRRRDTFLERLDGPVTPPMRAAFAFVLLAEMICLSVLVSSRPAGLVFAPLLGRWSMVVLATGARAARSDGRRLKFAPGVTFREFGWASTITFAVMFGTAELLGVVLGVAAAVISVAARVSLHRWLDGVTTTTLDAVCEIVQLLTVLILVVLQRP